MVFNPAIILTSSRILLAPFFAFFFLKSAEKGLMEVDMTWFFLSVLIVVLIELSDAFDGIIARARGEVTRFGKIFDPICDSISRQTVFLSFLAAGIIPVWMFMIFFYRDSLLSFIRIMNAVSGTVTAARVSGKLKAVFQALGIALVLTVIPVQNMTDLIPSEVWGRHPGFWIMVFPAFFTFVSMFDYIVPSWPVIKEMAEPEKGDKD